MRCSWCRNSAPLVALEALIAWVSCRLAVVPPRASRQKGWLVLSSCSFERRSPILLGPAFRSLRLCQRSSGRLFAPACLFTLWRNARRSRCARILWRRLPSSVGQVQDHKEECARKADDRYPSMPPASMAGPGCTPEAHRNCFPSIATQRKRRILRAGSFARGHCPSEALRAQQHSMERERATARLPDTVGQGLNAVVGNREKVA